ncbi:ElyC/SanA/YdcF family protein [Eubacteriaceae bacterium ES2]|nr:ElyC/SanA/YdcF family protein [Eubacteriaceae bacterium ES2]
MKKVFKSILIAANLIQLLLFFSLIGFGAYVFLNPDTVVDWLAHFLVKEDPLQNADVIVVIGGEENKLRLAYGVSLLEQGYAQKIVFSGVGNEDFAGDLLAEKGIGQDQYYFEQTATTTFENAYNLIPYVTENNIQSMILVSSPVQSRRARFMFQKVFPDQTIISTYSPDSIYDPDLVFDDKAIRQQMSTEVTKSLYYYMKYAFYRQ